MTKLWMIEIGREEANGRYLANIISTIEGKGKSIEGPTLKGVMAELSKSVRKRQSKNLRFPPPAPGVIIAPNGFDGKVIVPARN